MHHPKLISGKRSLARLRRKDAEPDPKALPCSLAIVLGSFLSATPALAQESTGTVHDSARRYQVISPGGVSYASGAFTYSLPLLSIGSGEFPRSLSYALSYNSGSARQPNQAWTHNLLLRTSRTLVDDPATTVPEPDGKPHPEWQTWLYNIVMGQRSEGFENYGANQGTNPYEPVTKTGSTLVFNSPGFHLFTGSRGEIIQFRPVGDSVALGRGDIWTEPDGTKLKFSYTASAMTVENNLGYALYMEAPVLVTTGIYDQEICVLNLTQYYLPSISSCPVGVPTAKVRSTALTHSGYGEVSTATVPTGGVYNFSYAQSTRGGKTRRALSCVKEPGSSVCSVSNSYDTCDAYSATSPQGASEDDSLWTGSRDRVIRQDFPTGEFVTYAWSNQSSGCRRNPSVTTADAVQASTQIAALDSGGITNLTDPLSRQSVLTYTGHVGTYTLGATLTESVTEPEANKTQYTYDPRGNLLETRKTAKSGSTLAQIVTSATYPSSCTYRATCNKPVTTTDANGNVTGYTYNNTHGGVLTEAGPFVGSFQPVRRFEYVQRYAWIKNSSGGYSQAASPVWLLLRERACATSGTLSSPCASSDEIVTEYDYGPNSGPNNLFVRGITVTAGGQTLRTCYRYDSLGRKISETKPGALLTSCP